jgi:thiosulfate/3-mercaptopyruvate sulfurtransferase
MNPLISPEELIAEEGDIILVDVRHDLNDPTAGLRAYAQGHLPNAAFLSVDEDLSGEPGPGNAGRHPLPRPEDFAARLRELGATEDTLLIAYDSSGGIFAARFWWLCGWIGHLRVGVLNGGIQAWVAADGPLQTEDYKPPEKKASDRGEAIAVHPSACPRWNLEMVETWVKTGSLPEIATLIDARAPDRYRGEVEPFDPVAGHIPGAQSRPATLNLDATGRFKPASQLREEFLQLLGEQDPSAVVHSCGSGITACHNLLAMEVAGLVGSALYPGSWSEWCGDSARPVATGPAP